MTRFIVGVSAAALMGGSTPALAQVNTTSTPPAAQAPAADTGEARADTTPAQPPAAAPRDIVVTGRRLDNARAAIQPSLGATSYTITNSTIQALPGGDNQQLNQIVLQLPGVVQDSYGQLHVRDDHNGLQYRINGTILPEGLAVFGQTLAPRLIDHFSLLTGALPAQYGLRTAGIIDITTKSGLFDNGGTLSLYGGSHETIEPSVEYGGNTGSTNFFVSGDYRHDDLGIENVDASASALHDRTDQFQGFAFLDHTLSDSDRVSFVGGISNDYFEIPNPRGLTPAAGYTIDGQTSYLSDKLNERQLEKTYFGQGAWLHDAGPLTVQSSLALRYSSLRYRPDELGELLFNGEAQQAYKQDFAVLGQVDAAYKAGNANTIRAGAILSRDHGYSRTNTAVFPVDTAGTQSGPPITLDDKGGATEWTESVYLQDELKLLPVLTFNFGGRFDHYAAYRDEQQFSPRANVVYQQGGTTVHAGYARYFSPPPFELVAATTVGEFAGTSAAPVVTADTTPYAERQDYLDLGVQRKIGETLTIGVDGYHRRSRNLIDEGQFGAPIILTPFNYARGRIDGVEANVSYTRRGLLVYANFAFARAKGENIVSSQFSFSPGELAYIGSHYIFLDHDQTYTSSGGASYTIRSGELAGLKFSADALYGSGLRADEVLVDGSAIPNGGKVPPYAIINLSVSYHFAGPGIGLRFDIINVGDHVYEIRDGTGVGVGAPQFGARRGFFVGLSKDL